jgi:hypothetical protein
MMLGEDLSAFPLRQSFIPVPHVYRELPVFLRNPEDAIGRIVLFGYSVTGKRGGKSTPSEIYAQDNKKQLANSRLFKKRLEEMKSNKKNSIPMRQVQEVPSLKSCSTDVHDHYKKRAEQEIDFQYYCVHAVYKIPAEEGLGSGGVGRGGEGEGGGVGECEGEDTSAIEGREGREVVVGGGGGGGGLGGGGGGGGGGG